MNKFLAVIIMCFSFLGGFSETSTAGDCTSSFNTEDIISWDGTRSSFIEMYVDMDGDKVADIIYYFLLDRRSSVECKDCVGSMKESAEHYIFITEYNTTDISSKYGDIEREEDIYNEAEGELEIIMELNPVPQFEPGPYDMEKIPIENAEPSIVITQKLKDSLPPQEQYMIWKGCIAQHIIVKGE